FKDYKKLLEDKNVDAVVIATPDHWHALMFIDACNAGKDVYVEKPLSLTVVEGRRMVETAERTKRVVQVGTNRRSWKTYIEAAEWAGAGGSGLATAARPSTTNRGRATGRAPPPPRPPRGEEEGAGGPGPAAKGPPPPPPPFQHLPVFQNPRGGVLKNWGAPF